MQWRRKEISDLKMILRSKKSSLENKVLTKSLVLISYSHWEGFVKNTASKYLELVKFLGLKGSKLSPCLRSAAIFNEICSKAISTAAKIELIKDAITDASFVHPINPERQVDAESNLNSEVFQKIILNIGANTNPIELEMPYLDREILNNRNGCAHGDNLFLDPEKGIEIADKCMELMDKFKTMVENMIAQKSYQASIP